MEVFFSIGTRVSYPVEVKQKAVEMRLAGVPVKEIMQELNIKNKTLYMHLTSIRKLLKQKALP
ncbi:helix-turn-helix domain-containing protein [Bacillus atrophaeus]|uniref:helix-turn-helix domain-containing protein n=1 Tax=Bacillus atrophaeus TaxID=1452 RepID=UPI002E1FA287|nr:helix-turn-helix domain-containing protein [Bacillus atrophaeus]